MFDCETGAQTHNSEQFSERERVYVLGAEQGIARLFRGDNSHIFASSIKVEQLAELKINSEKLYCYIEEELDDREREIICKRYGVSNTDGSLYKPMTQRENVKEMGISRSYISRIEKRALTKLNKRFNDGGV